MTHTVSFHPAALAEVEDAEAWYAAERVELGHSSSTVAEGAEGAEGQGSAWAAGISAVQQVGLTTWDWATLLQRVWGVDALKCEGCGGRMRFIAVISGPRGGRADPQAHRRGR